MVGGFPTDPGFHRRPQPEAPAVFLRRLPVVVEHPRDDVVVIVVAAVARDVDQESFPTGSHRPTYSSTTTTTTATTTSDSAQLCDATDGRGVAVVTAELLHLARAAHGLQAADSSLRAQADAGQQQNQQQQQQQPRRLQQQL